MNFSTKFWFKMTKLMMNQFQKRNQFHIRNWFLQRNRFLLKTIPFAKGIDSFKKCQKWPKNRNRDSFGIGIDTALICSWKWHKTTSDSPSHRSQIRALHVTEPNRVSTSVKHWASERADLTRAMLGGASMAHAANQPTIRINASNCPSV